MFTPWDNPVSCSRYPAYPWLDSYLNNPTGDDNGPESDVECARKFQLTLNVQRSMTSPDDQQIVVMINTKY